MSAQAAVPTQNHAYVDAAEFTPYFCWKKDKTGKSESVFCEGFSLAAAAEKFGSPLYLYSRAAIETAYSELDRELAGLRQRLCFAWKLNGNLSVLTNLAK